MSDKRKEISERSGEWSVVSGKILLSVFIGTGNPEISKYQNSEIPKSQNQKARTALT
jgi:hypothetical protein